MIHYYSVSKNNIEATSVYQADWISVVSPSPDEKKELIQKYGMAEEILAIRDFPETISRMEHIPLKNTDKGTLLTLIYPHFKEKNHMEQDLEVLSFLFMEGKVLSICSKKDHVYAFFKQFTKEWNPYKYVGNFIIRMYDAYLERLKIEKEKINRVTEEAETSMKRDLLLKITAVERDLVFIEHTLVNQEEIIEKWLDDEWINKGTHEKQLENEIRVKIQTAKKMVRLYRELVDSTSGLISDIMDNKLNNIMEQLETMNLIVAVPTLIFSLWGINTGGLLWRESRWGSVIVIGIAVILGLITAFYLKRKEFKE